MTTLQFTNNKKHPRRTPLRWYARHVAPWALMVAFAMYLRSEPLTGNKKSLYLLSFLGVQIILIAMDIMEGNQNFFKRAVGGRGLAVILLFFFFSVIAPFAASATGIQGQVYNAVYVIVMLAAFFALIRIVRQNLER